MRKVVIFTMCSVLALSANTAFAQEANQEAGASDSTSDIVVTAQRRQERLQDVPIAISAVTADALERRGINQTMDLSATVPGLTITRSVHQVAPYVRGVGSASTSLGNDPSVAVYVDGVYQSAPTGLLFSFNNIQRVEVLKGPQGTLFGRNATGGLIQIVTGRPSSDLTGRFTASYGNFDTISATGYISGGNDSGAVDLGVIYTKQSNGWGRNLWTPAQAGTTLLNGVPVTVPAPQSLEAGTLTEYGIRSKGVFDLSDSTTLTVSGIYTHSSSDQGVYRRGLPGAKLINGFVFQGGFWDYNNDVSPISVSDVEQVSATLEHEADFATLRSISAYYYAKNTNRVPSDGVPAVSDFQAFFKDSHVRSLSQELQVLSPSGSSLQWILGAFYMDSFSIYNPIQLAFGNIAPTQDRYGQQSLKSLAGFGQATYEIFPDTKLTAGVRYTQDKLKASSFAVARRTTATQVDGQVLQNVPEQSTKQGRWTWRAALDHKFTDDVLAYASISSGYKAGNYNIQALCLAAGPSGSCARVAPPTLPETLTSYEVGLKTSPFDRAVTLNLSAFYYDYKNLQVQTVVQINNIAANIVYNAAAAKIYGMEIESTATITPRLRLGASVSLLHTEYTDFPNAVVAVPRTVAPFANTTVTIPNAAGNKLSRAPKFTGNASIDYTVPTGIGDLNFSANYYYNSGFYWEVSNRLREQSYHLLNTQVSLEFNQGFAIRAWAKNLINENYYAYQQASNDGDQGAPAAPRTYGVTLEYKF